MQKSFTENLTGKRLLARNTFFNFIGQAAPAIVLLLTVPMIIRGLGNDRFGILTLAWTVLGYFSLFDLGLGRALTALVAAQIGSNRKTAIPASVWTSLAIMGALGLMGAIVVAAVSPVLVRHALKIPTVLQPESLTSFYLLAFSIPVVLSTAALRGVLEAHQRFDLVNMARVPLGIFMYASPLLVLPFSRSLVWVTGILVLGRMAAWVIHFRLCLRVLPEFWIRRTVTRTLARQLLHLGCWMTVSNIVSPLMVYLDRFLIGAFVSITAVAYYTTPYEAVTKLWIVSGAFIGVLFPAFSAAYTANRAKAAQLFDQGFNYVFMAMLPLSLILVLFAREGLSFWLNPEFADHSARIMQWLAAGIFINSLAQVPFAFLQGSGRPDITAKLHLVQLPFYLTAAWILIHKIGIEGAAIAWVGRIIVDTVLSFAAAYRIFPESAAFRKSQTALIVGGSSLFILAALIPSLLLKAIFSIGILFLYILVSWFFVLQSGDKTLIRGMLRMRQAGEAGIR